MLSAYLSGSNLGDVISLAQTPKCLAESPRVHAGPSGHFGDSAQVFLLSKAGKSVVCWWIPGHTGLLSSEPLRILTLDWILDSNVNFFFLHAVGHCVKMNGSRHRITDCELWSHLYKCGSISLAPSGGRNSWLHSYGLVMLLNTHIWCL
jgi:hypothetical protein